MIDANKVFILARKHLANNTSARACMDDAMRAQANGDLTNSIRWALRSLAHSVGILHKDYARAFKHSGIGGETRLVSIILGEYPRWKAQWSQAMTKNEGTV